MIQLTRLNKHPLIVNSDLIKLIESAPDTVLTLVTGEKIVVLEPCDQVLEKIVEFRQRILSGLASKTADICSSETGAMQEAQHLAKES